MTHLDDLARAISPKSPAIRAFAIEAARQIDALTNPAPPPVPALPFTIGAELWHGTKSADWSNPPGGGWFNSGGGSNLDTPQGVKLSITASPGGGDSGARGFRWQEFYDNPQAYGVADCTFPTAPVVAGWLQVMQLKSRGATTDPFWYVQLIPALGGLTPILVWWNHLAGKGVEGPHSGQHLASYAVPSNVWLPAAGTSFQLGMAVKESAAFTGRVVVTLDGRAVIDVPLVKTGYPDSSKPSGCSQQWSVNLYGNSVSPSPLTMLVSDASVWKVTGL